MTLKHKLAAKAPRSTCQKNRTTPASCPKLWGLKNTCWNTKMRCWQRRASWTVKKKGSSFRTNRPHLSQSVTDFDDSGSNQSGMHAPVNGSVHMPGLQGREELVKRGLSRVQELQRSTSRGLETTRHFGMSIPTVPLGGQGSLVLSAFIRALPPFLPGCWLKPLRYLGYTRTDRTGAYPKLLSRHSFLKSKGKLPQEYYK